MRPILSADFLAHQTACLYGRHQNCVRSSKTNSWVGEAKQAIASCNGSLVLLQLVDINGSQNTLLQAPKPPILLMIVDNST